MKSNPCKMCGSVWHTAFKCHLRPQKALKQIGKQAKRTMKAVAEWKQTQKPNHQGYFQCYMCGARIPYLMAEHVKSKARRPDLREAWSNLKPSCALCNKNKGSKNN